MAGLGDEQATQGRLDFWAVCSRRSNVSVTASRLFGRRNQKSTRSTSAVSFANSRGHHH